MHARRLPMLLAAATGVACLAACTSTTDGSAEFAGATATTAVDSARPSQSQTIAASASPSEAPSRPSGAESPTDTAGESGSSGGDRAKPSLCSEVRKLDLKAIFGRQPQLDDLGDENYCFINTTDTVIFLRITFADDTSVIDSLSPSDTRPLTVAGQPGLYKFDTEMAVSTVGDIHKDGAFYVSLDDEPDFLDKAKRLIALLLPTYKG